MSRPRVFVWQGRLPLWPLLLLALPLAGLFLFSLVVAGAVALGAALIVPLLLPRRHQRRPPPSDGTIELDPSQYRRLPDTDDRRRE